MSWNHVTYKVALHTGKQTLFAVREPSQTCSLAISGFASRTSSTVAMLAEMLLAQSEKGIVSTPSAEAGLSAEQCTNTASSVEAGDPKSMTAENIAAASRTLYTCAMDAYRRNDPKWFIPSAKARGLLLDELVTRARNAAFATSTPAKK